VHTLKRLKGIAFDIDDLHRARSWATFHGWKMLLWLDHGVDGEEYEEVIGFRRQTDALAGCILWRTASAVFVQPLLGKRRRYTSLTQALDSLLPKRRVVGVSL
jgi:hypothetical protein